MEIETDWKAFIKAEGLDTRTSGELDQMLPAHEVKIAPAERELYWLTRYPDSLRRQLEEAGETTPEEIEEEVQSQIAYYQWKVDKLKSVVALIGKEKELRAVRI